MTADGQAGDGGGGKAGQHAQGLRRPELDDHGGGIRENEILQIGQSHIHGADQGRMGDLAGLFIHKILLFDRPSPERAQKNERNAPISNLLVLFTDRMVPNCPM